jgi:HemY protein
MRTLLWVVTLFGIAVGLTVLTQAQPGVVQFVFPGLRVELAFALFVVLLLAFGLLFGTAVRLFRAALSLPRRVSAHREAVAEKRARQELDAALRAFFENRWSRAERHAARALDTGSTAVLAQIVAARAAQAQRQYGRAEQYLDHPTRVTGNDRWMSTFARAELLVQRKRAAEALPLLRDLRRNAPSHSGALRLEIQAQSNAGQWGEVLKLTEQAARHGAFDPATLNQYRENAITGLLLDPGVDLAALNRLWRQTALPLRLLPRVADAGARAFSRLGDAEAAHTCLQESIEQEWSGELAALDLALSEDQESAQALQRGESWLRSHPTDTMLLLALGRLCRSRGLWGKARNYLEAAIAIHPQACSHRMLAELLESLGDAAAALPHLKAAANLAADEAACGKA